MCALVSTGRVSREQAATRRARRAPKHVSDRACNRNVGTRQGRARPLARLPHRSAPDAGGRGLSWMPGVGMRARRHGGCGLSGLRAVPREPPLQAVAFLRRVDVEKHVEDIREIRGHRMPGPIPRIDLAFSRREEGQHVGQQGAPRSGRTRAACARRHGPPRSRLRRRAIAACRRGPRSSDDERRIARARSAGAGSSDASRALAIPCQRTGETADCVGDDAASGGGAVRVARCGSRSRSTSADLRAERVGGVRDHRACRRPSTRPLSSPPMRRALPPARTTAVMSSSRIGFHHARCLIGARVPMACPRRSRVKRSPTLIHSAYLARSFGRR